jgi:hypothetical protein
MASTRSSELAPALAMDAEAGGSAAAVATLPLPVRVERNQPVGRSGDYAGASSRACCSPGTSSHRLMRRRCASDCQIEGRFRWRLSLTPGLTGLWQVHGRSDIPIEQMVNLDYLYVTNWSLWGDVKLVMRTVSAVLRGSGAY